MANQDTKIANGEDFSQDVTTEQSTENIQQQQQNGGGGGSVGGGGGGGGGDAPPVDSGSADKPGKDDDRKLFVGGLSWETTDRELRVYFGQYGEIESINVKTDSMTGRSRGFAFIVFKDAESIDKVAAAGEHTINGKKVDPKKAKVRHGKIFVGGLPPELSDSDIKDYFAQFGTIIEMEMPFDKQKNQRKGFCFLTFESELVVQELLKTQKQTIDGREVDVKKATPKPDQMMMERRSMRGFRGGPRGRGGSRGTGGGGGYGQWGSGYGYNNYNQNYGYDGYSPSYDYYGGGGYGGGGNYGNYDYSGYSGNYDQGYGYEGGYGGGGGGGGGGRSNSRGKVQSVRPTTKKQPSTWSQQQ